MVLFVFLLASGGVGAQVPYVIPESMVVSGPYMTAETTMWSGTIYHHSVGFKKFVNSLLPTIPTIL